MEWLGAPSSGTVANGDYYLNTANGAVYNKASGSWSVIANITGPQGTAGTNGANGTNGTNGATWWSGSGAPSSGTGANGDYYLNTANGAVYNKASGSWSVIANITGPAGGSVATQTYSCGRLTAQNGVPVPTADQTAVSTLYFTPYNGNVLTVLNGSGVKVHDQFAQLSVSVPNTVATLYDVFAYDNGGTLALDTPVAWSSSGAGTSARASAISLVDGMWVKTSDNTRRLVGTFMTSGTGGQTTDSAQYRLVPPRSIPCSVWGRLAARSLIPTPSVGGTPGMPT